MRLASSIVLVLAALAAPLHAQPQRMQQREEDFLKSKPLIGDPLPDVEVYSSDGSTFKTAELRGHYTVLTFGCLTCPPSIWNIAGLEAVQRDYGPKGVKFFFIYKALAHPELVDNYVQPFTQEERLSQARQAEKQFGTTIPWIVDAMDNRLKHALGDRPNCQFLVSPDGVIVRKRAWSHPGLVRKDLEELVGPVEHVTQVEDLHLKFGPAIPSAAPRGVLQRIPRPEMQAIVAEPQISPGAPKFFAKLRVEADASLVRTGAGKLYLGFHLDPFHDAHWNNLTKPLAWKIESVDGVKLDAWEGTGAKVEVATDADPREFLVNVQSWPQETPLRLAVVYYACVGKDTCHAVRQEYVLHCERDTEGGGARGTGAGLWDQVEFSGRMLAGDKDGDGKLTRKECVGIALPHFDKLDANHDELLDGEELKTIADWLNFHHQPGTPAPQKSGKKEGAQGALDPVRTGKSRYDWKWLAESFDADKSGSVSRNEVAASDEVFQRLDRTWDGVLTENDFDWSAEGPLSSRKETVFALFKSVDKSSDGRLSADEWRALFEKQSGEVGMLDQEDLERLLYLPRVVKAQKDQEGKWRSLETILDNGKPVVDVPEPGETAPDFELRSPDGKTTVQLSSFRGQKPVVLIFGCLTCGNYRTYSEPCEALYRRWKDQVEFVRVYVREAHPDDLGPTSTNARAGISIKQPVTMSERCTVAERFTSDFKVETPLVVDEMDNNVGRTYGGWPDRLYVVGRDGRIVYQGGPGPFAFNPAEMEQALLLMLIHEQVADRLSTAG